MEVLCFCLGPTPPLSFLYVTGIYFYLCPLFYIEIQLVLNYLPSKAWLLRFLLVWSGAAAVFSDLTPFVQDG